MISLISISDIETESQRIILEITRDINRYPNAFQNCVDFLKQLDLYILQVIQVCTYVYPWFPDVPEQYSIENNEWWIYFESYGGQSFQFIDSKIYYQQRHHICETSQVQRSLTAIDIATAIKILTQICEEIVND